MSDESEDRTIYRVVVNQDEQYSVWPAQREIPAGWRDAVPGRVGLKAECLVYIEEVWTDLRPRRVRQQRP